MVPQNPEKMAKPQGISKEQWQRTVAKSSGKEQWQEQWQRAVAINNLQFAHYRQLVSHNS